MIKEDDVYDSDKDNNDNKNNNTNKYINSTVLLALYLQRPILSREWLAEEWHLINVWHWKTYLDSAFLLSYKHNGRSFYNGRYTPTRKTSDMHKDALLMSHQAYKCLSLLHVFSLS